MTRPRILLVLAALLGVLALAGCGGGDDGVPGDAIAVVGDQEIARGEFDDVIDQAKQTYKSQKRPFPKAGSPEFNQLKQQAVRYLVQKSMFEQKAEDLDIEVTDDEIDKKIADLKKQFFGGDEKKWQAQLKAQGFTQDELRDSVRTNILQEELYNKVTEDVKVSDKDIAAFYAKNKSRYTQPESRDVRSEQGQKQCLPDAKAKARAQDVFEQVKAGGNFAALAKKYSNDPGSKDTGGKLTIQRGQTVAPFDQTAFLLGKGTTSQPVKTRFGYHIIQPVSDVKKKKVTALKDVKEQIRAELEQTKKSEAMTKWVEDTRKDFDKKTTYQVGFKPPASVTTSTAAG
jgi:parvulin-like peptidyl-prolyl isomerase